MKKIIILLFLIFMLAIICSQNLWAQTKSNISLSDSITSFTGKSGTKAILYSAFLPGGGQVYNDKYMKAGIVFGLETLFLGSGIYYQVKREKAWDDYIDSGNQQDYDDYNDYHLKSQSMYWWFFSIKFLSVLDAYVDAKLFNYEKKKKQLEFKLEGNSFSINYQF